jgi:hypothetical protein
MIPDSSRGKVLLPAENNQLLILKQKLRLAEK